MSENTESKLRKMEEEMSRFEAEIASQVQTDKIVGLSFPQATPFGSQILSNQFCPGIIGSTSMVTMPSAPGVYMSMNQPIYASIPHSMRSMYAAVESKPVQTPAPCVEAPGSKTTISAPPQMAGPNELAARAKEAKAAAEAAKLKAEEDDDDVTRALLAAAAGVTYTRTLGTNGKESVKATITKPLANQTTPKTTSSLVSKAQPVVSKPSVPPPIYSLNVDTSIPPPPAPVPAVRSSHTSTEELYSFQKKKYRRVAAGLVWEDPTLSEWDSNDFRLFCGDLGNEVSDDTLTRAFSRYASFLKAKVVLDKRSGKSRGYGFVSFSDPTDFTRAMREMNGKYIGNRPIKLKKSDWKSRQLETYRKREKEKKKLGLKI